MVKIIKGEKSRGKFGRLQRFSYRSGKVNACIRLGKGTGAGKYIHLNASHIIPDPTPMNNNENMQPGQVDRNMYIREVMYHMHKGRIVFLFLRHLHIFHKMWIQTKVKA